MRGYLAIAAVIVVLAAVWAVAMFLVFEPHFFLPGAG
jgi:hypothetical protein